MAKGKSVRIRFGPAERKRTPKPIRFITTKENFARRYDAKYDAMRKVLVARQRGIVREMNTEGLSPEQRSGLRGRFNEAQRQLGLLNKKYNLRKRVLDAQSQLQKRHKGFPCYLTDPYFAERVELDGKKHQRSALAYVDLDYLHGVNTLVRHRGGNVVLRALGDALNDAIGAKGGFAGKHGGEEILVWAPVSQAEMAGLLQKAAELFRQKLAMGLAAEKVKPLTEKAINQKERSGGISGDEAERVRGMRARYPDIGRFSAGIVEMDRNEIIRGFGATYGKAIDTADALHYRAKHKGRNLLALVSNKKVSFQKTLN
ncbi:MAG: diguanylate cyclase [Candidatus Diapherotrites archaeon]